MDNQYFFTASYTVADAQRPAITIEAEYGERVVCGGLYTAAHHQPDMKGLPAPCNDWDIPVCEGVMVMISHFDLDTLGGCLRTEEKCQDLFYPQHEAFWALAEYVDLNGPHMMETYLARLGAEGYYQKERACIQAFWAWSKTQPRLKGDELQNVTSLIKKGAHALRKIFAGDPDLIEAGVALKEAEEELNGGSFDRTANPRDDLSGQIILRQWDGFVNHLYNLPGDTNICGGVASLNTATGAVTISLARPIEGVSCREIMQELFGPEAGGHDGIAGTPRGQRFTIENRNRAAEALVEEIALCKEKYMP